MSTLKSVNLTISFLLELALVVTAATWVFGLPAGKMNIRLGPFDNRLLWCRAVQTPAEVENLQLLRGQVMLWIHVW